MVSQDKIEAVEEIKGRLDDADAAFLTEYRGLSVAQQQELRRSLRAAGSEYRVMKMSLARRAADDLGLAELTEWLAGPTAIAFVHGDPVPAAKALKGFSRDHESLVLKVGLLEGQVLAPEQVSRLADLEPRGVLLGQMAGALQAPLTKVAGTLVSFTRNAASAFAQLVEKKEEELPPPEDKVEEQPPPEAKEDEQPPPPDQPPEISEQETEQQETEQEE